MVCILDRGLDISHLANSQHSLVIHIDAVVMPQVIIDPAVSLVRALCVDALDLLGQFLILYSPATLPPAGPPVVGRTRYMEQLTPQFYGMPTLLYGPI